MTIPLQSGSSRHLAAERFGAELRKAMAARQIGSKSLGPRAGCASSAIGAWRAGDNLPRLETAERLAESLQWPRLLVLARDGRVDHCARCGAEFSNEGGKPKRFCSDQCRQVDTMLREPPPGRALAETVRDELARVHGTEAAVRRKVLAAALAQYNRSDSKRQPRIDRSARQLTVVQVAVAGYCRGCEPAGVCHAAECELRPVSPLPLAVSPKIADIAERPQGVHGPDHRAAWLEANRAANARRWDRPGERERAAAVIRLRLGSAGSPERLEHGRVVSEGRRRARARCV